MHRDEDRLLEARIGRGPTLFVRYLGALVRHYEEGFWLVLLTLLNTFAYMAAWWYIKKQMAELWRAIVYTQKAKLREMDQGGTMHVPTVSKTLPRRLLISQDAAGLRFWTVFGSGVSI